MDFLRNVTKDISKKSGQLVETTKLSAKINSEENKIDKIYIDLGKQMYQDFRNGESFKEQYMVMFSDISIIKSNIDSLREDLRKLKGVVLCSSCGEEVKKDAKFCTSCGNKVEQHEEPISTKNCKQCGAMLKDDSKYCPDCGIVIQD